jgi:hypothetical protein
MEELWYPIPGASRYSVSTHANVRNNRTGRILKPSGADVLRSSWGYVALRGDDGILLRCSVQKLTLEVAYHEYYSEPN